MSPDAEVSGVQTSESVPEVPSDSVAAQVWPGGQ